MGQCNQLISSQGKSVSTESRQAVFAPVVMDIDVPSLHVFAEAVDSSLFLSKEPVPVVEDRAFSPAPKPALGQENPRVLNTKGRDKALLQSLPPEQRKVIIPSTRGSPWPIKNIP
mmetsp:Transcript_5789/g.12586  ORF Transcript_5789/g.12586 Transcript_5789/m.12586 type:complete len:115 (-) Transcript_5789:1955-2299(-)